MIDRVRQHMATYPFIYALVTFILGAGGGMTPGLIVDHRPDPWTSLDDERQDAQQEEMLKLWCENKINEIISKRVPPPEVELKLDQLQSENMRLRTKMEALEVSCKQE